MKPSKSILTQLMIINVAVTRTKRYLYQLYPKIKLVVMMSSANGVIPAGIILFNPCESESLERVEQTLQLEKCPDRTATIKFTRWYEFLRTSYNNNNLSGNVQQSNYLDTRYTLKNPKSQLKHSTYTSQGYGRSSKYSPAKRDITPNRLNIVNSQQGQNNGGLTPRSRVRTYTSPVYENHPQQTRSTMYPPQDNYRIAESYM